MSHISETKTGITNPNLACLTQAVQLVAQQHSGEVRTQYLDFSRNPHDVSTGLAIFTPELIRGIGVEVANGELTFLGDDWAVHEWFEKVQREVKQAYVSICYMQALQQCGYQPQATDGENRRVVIEAVPYA